MFEKEYVMCVKNKYLDDIYYYKFDDSKELQSFYLNRFDKKHPNVNEIKILDTYKFWPEGIKKMIIVNQMN
jgi:hypothetical protein